MRSFVQEGLTLDLPVPYDVAAGAAFKIGAIIAVASTAGVLASADVVAGWVSGVYTLAKATGAAWSIGDLLYWDDTAKNVTKTATSNTKIGYATAAALSADTTGTLRLVPTI